VGACTTAWNVSNANLSGVLTDKPAGVAVTDLPYEQMIRDHALWCSTNGAEGKPSDFSGADLRLLSTLRGLNLTALSAKDAVLYGLDLCGAQLQGAHLEGADLRSCDLSGADLRGARLAGAKLSGSSLCGALLGPLILGPDRLLPCDMTGVVMKNADLTGADLSRAELSGADVSWSNFTDANLKLINLTGAARRGARGLESVI
jgi:uncharacterized protein YjbI with pentapeptide repeats